LIGNSSGGSGYDPTDLLDLDPHLGPLQDNGGPTWTHALLAGSPALDAGNSALLPADTLDLDGDGDTTEPIPFDQRGSGSFRVVNGKLDVGAFEVQAAARSTVTTSPGALGATLAAVGPPVPVAAAPVRGVATGVEVFVPSNSPGGLGDAWLGALDRLFAEDLLFGNKLRRHDP
jgi:hypothetical protein